MVLLLVVVGAAYGYARYRYGQIDKLHITAEQAAISGQPFNLLMVGSDSRAGLTTSQQAQVGTESTVGGHRSDVIMVWHVDPGTKQVRIMSIPRDTLISVIPSETSTYGQFNRINTAFDTGPNTLVQTIEQNFGIPISHVVQVDFSGFIGATNALGGVWMDFPYPAKDAWSGLDITTPGCQLLDGTQALSVARSRHYEYLTDGYWHQDESNDFGRIDRQDAFIRALIDAAKSKYNPATINAFLGSLPQGLKIDDAMSFNDLLGLAVDFHGIDPSELGSTTLPVHENTEHSAQGYVAPWGDIQFVDQPAAQQLLVSIFGNQLQAPTSPPPNFDLTPSPPPIVSAAPAPGARTSSASGTASARTASASGTAGSKTVAAASTAATTTTTTAPSEPSFDPVPCSPK